jgi:iron complex outermembrane receptor protein
LVGNPNLDPEYLRGFELGYRFQPDKKFSLDLATFFNHYTDLIEPEIGQPFFEAGPPSRLVLPMISQNDVSGNSLGGELAAKWSPMKTLRFALAYSFIQMQLNQAANTFGDPATELATLTPRHKLTVNSSVNLTHNVTFTPQVSFVDRRVAQDLPGYTTVDTAFAWKPSQSWQLKTGAFNLFNKEHIEFVDPAAGLSTMIGRSVYGQATWRF